MDAPSGAAGFASFSDPFEPFGALGLVAAAFGLSVAVELFGAAFSPAFGAAAGFEVAVGAAVPAAAGFAVAVGAAVPAAAGIAVAFGFAAARFGAASAGAFFAGGAEVAGAVVAAAVLLAAFPAAPAFAGGFGFVRRAGLGFGAVVADAFAFAAVPAAPPFAGALGFALARAGAVPEWNPPGSPGFGAPEVASRPLPRVGAGGAAVVASRVRAVSVRPVAAPVFVPPARGASAVSVVGVTVMSESS